MKKIFILAVLAFLMISMISVVNANGIEASVVAGLIFRDDNGGPVPGASVEVTCNNIIKNIESDDDGWYTAVFDLSECDCNDTVQVYAEKDGLYGSNSGTISNCYTHPELILNIGIVNVPLIPEFGLIVGSLTVISAIVVFFIIRRR